MGKRKTRKRSRRSRKKTGGLYGINSLCVWYGSGNVGTKGFFGKKARKSGDIKGGSECNAISVRPPDGATVLSINDKKMVLQEHKLIERLPNQLGKISKLKTFEDMEEEVKESGDEVQYDIYAVRYEEKCASLGERYELYKIRDATIKEAPDLPGYAVSTTYWNDKMYFTINNDKLDMRWGNTEPPGIPKTSLLLALSEKQRRHTIGGKRRRRSTKKRRRSTKKKRRKKRKRTKKKRRRR